MRIEGWEKLLDLHITQAGPFVWGFNDCALWCADWVHKATGKDFLSDWLGEYTSEAGLTILMAERGFWHVADIAEHHLPTTPLALAKRGDIMLHPQGCLGICNGVFSYFLMERGVTRLSTLLCKRSWKVD